MYLYNSYCYSSLQLAADSFYSQGIIQNIGIMQSYSLILPDKASFIYTADPSKKVFNSFEYRFAECYQQGFDNSFFGVTPHNAIDMAWLVAGVLVSAWAFKALKEVL